MNTVFGFLVTTLLTLLLFYIGSGRDKRVLLVSTIWLALIGGLSITGFFENTTSLPPRYLLVFLGSTGLIIYLYKVLKTDRLNTKRLLLVQGLRLPVEIGLYQLFLQGQIPQIMTFEGWNYDIIIGISALIIFVVLYFKEHLLSKTFMLIWNITGVLFLAVIVLTAVLSAPLPIQLLAFDQPNVAVLKFPYVFLPAYIVPLVLLTHLLTIKKILKEVPKR
jgi:hypothetical protein